MGSAQAFMLSALLREKENAIFFEGPREAVCPQLNSPVSQNGLCMLLRKDGK